MNWFNSVDLLSSTDHKSHTIVLDDIYGYVLPHAGTKYTGKIIQHTLRFRPRNIEKTKRVYIYYYPANQTPDIMLSIDENDTAISDDRVIISSLSMKTECHHELYVPFRSILHYFRSWGVNIDRIKFISVNIQNKLTSKGNQTPRQKQAQYRANTRRYRRVTNGDFYIISADFSHHKLFQYAISNENKAAHAILTNSLLQPRDYINEIDDVRTFRAFTKIHPNLSFQWIGRTRSPGENAVGYLSFLIRPLFRPANCNTPIDGIFVTCYDSHMNARECLGEWFSETTGHSWSLETENNFITKVKHKAQTESRLTGGRGTNLPITRCVVTYLFKEHKQQPFIRGWHSIQTSAIYLPDVLLEHAKEDGSWITDADTEWNTNDNGDDEFDLTETLEELTRKAGSSAAKDDRLTLYTTRIRIKK
jgi:hypothetical protein